MPREERDAFAERLHEKYGEFEEGNEERPDVAESDPEPEEVEPRATPSDD